MGPAQIKAFSDLAMTGVEIDRVVVDGRSAAAYRASLKLLQNPPDWLKGKWLGLITSQAAIMKPVLSGNVEYLVLSGEEDSSAASQAVIEFALKLKEHSEQEQNDGRLAPAELKPYIEDFLHAHNTCALSTVYQGQVSSRPIEYHFQDDALYLISEGGVKFAGLLSNGQAVITIYDPYRGFDNLAGMYLTGIASVPRIDSPEYERAMAICGLTLDRLHRLDFAMHTIIIRLVKADYLWSGFSHLGKAAHQIYYF